MLGHSGVGKTTYMASMYGTLQQSINGFSLRAQDNEDHYTLLNTFQEIRKNHYPPASLQRKQYDFSLLHQGKSYFSFQWVDYRGKALVERQDSSQEARQLVSELREADGIVVFCDSNAMSGGKAGRQVGRMMALVGQALENNERPITIAIVFTKADLVEDIDDELVEPVSGLLDAIGQSEFIAGTLIPVACGKELISTELPVLCILHFGVFFQAIQLTLEMQSLQAAQQHYTQRSNSWGGFFEDLGSIWKGNPTNDDIARFALEQAKEKKREIDQLIEPAEQLGDYLSELPLVLGTQLKQFLEG